MPIERSNKKPASSSISEKNAAFFSKFRSHIYDKEDIIVQAGEAQEHVFYIESGKVVQYDIAPNGGELTLNTLAAGAFLSASWLFTADHLSNFFYKSIEKTTIHVAPLQDVIEYMNANPDVALDLTARIARGSDGVLKRLSAQMSNSARTQLITELLLEAKRFPHPAKGGGVMIKLSINELSAKSGLARETVSRQLTKLYDEKLLVKQGSTFSIPNLHALENASM